MGTCYLGILAPTLVAFFLLSHSAAAQGLYFSLDAASPEIGVGAPPLEPGDALRPNFPGAPPTAVRPAAGFGLLSGEEIDALSTGTDTLCPMGGNCFTIIHYSADRATLGTPGGVVATQVASDGAAGDTFRISIRGDGVILSGSLLAANSTARVLTPLPPVQSDIDALEANDGPYFSIAPGTVAAASARWSIPSLSAADILAAPISPGAPAGVLFSRAALGLVPGDDIDGMALNVATGVVLVSLAPGSPSLGVIGASPADVIQVMPGAPAVYFNDFDLALRTSDNLNALTTIDPPFPVPALGPWGLCSLAALILAAGISRTRPKVPTSG